MLQRRDSNKIAYLTLSRPEKLNALSFELLEALSEALNQIKSDDNILGLIITGNGKAFCAGADINRLQAADAESGYQFAIHGQTIFRMLETLGKPSVAAINGFAFGGGCELAMACTHRVALSSAKLGQPEIKLGVIPGFGGTQRLARLVGQSRALDLCLSGRFIDANEAFQWGLVNQISGTENELMSTAEKWLTGVISLAPLAAKSIMSCIDRGFDMSYEEAEHLEAIHFAKVCASNDKHEGVSAFLEKRTPEFKGA